MTNTLHAHIATSSSDCDGMYSRTEVHFMEDAEKASDFGDIEFHERMLGLTVSVYALHTGGSLEVTMHGDLPVLEWEEPTEEGGIHKRTEFCDDERCQEERPTFRDHSAERAGY